MGQQPFNNRYVKPQTALEAMEIIQKLFNQYKNQPLTQELLNYHVNLTERLQGDILLAAKRENNPKVLGDLANMIVAMQTWAKIRTAHQPFAGKMKNFKLTTTTHQKFKQRTHKIKGQHNYRGVTH